MSSNTGLIVFAGLAGIAAVLYTAANSPVDSLNDTEKRMVAKCEKVVKDTFNTPGAKGPVSVPNPSKACACQLKQIKTIEYEIERKAALASYYTLAAANTEFLFPFSKLMSKNRRRHEKRIRKKMIAAGVDKEDLGQALRDVGKKTTRCFR